MPQVCLSLALTVALAALPAAPQRSVWTNDEIDLLPPGQAVSVPGSVTPATEAPAVEAPLAPYQRDLDPEWYRAQLAVVEQQVTLVNARMTQLRAFLANPRDNAEPGLRLDVSETGLSPANELELLELRRRALLEQASEIEEQVRRAGFPPGILR